MGVFVCLYLCLWTQMCMYTCIDVLMYCIVLYCIYNVVFLSSVCQLWQIAF